MLATERRELLPQHLSICGHLRINSFELLLEALIKFCAGNRLAVAITINLKEDRGGSRNLDSEIGGFSA
jgi:hypothetical protein